MSPAAILLIAMSMSADAFAAALARGAAHRPTLPQALRSGAVFGVVEAVTPLVGWALGKAARDYVTAVDHWIALALLSGVGLKMIWDALHPDEEAEVAPQGRRAPLALVATALGTSIDAAVVGGTLALIEANILVVAAAIGCATFVMATLGLLIGRAAGHRLGSVVEVLGGLVLIGLGMAIWLEHTHALG